MCAGLFTYRLHLGVDHVVIVDVNGLAVDLVGPATVVSDAGADEGELSGSQRNGLAVVVTLNGGELFGISVDQVGKLHQHAATVGGGGLPPCCVESLASSGNSNVDILLGGLADRGDDVLSGRVDDFELFLVNTLDELAVDEPCRREKMLAIVNKQWQIIVEAKTQQNHSVDGGAADGGDKTYRPIGWVYFP